MNEILIVDSVYLKKDGRDIVNGLTFSVPEGTLCAILGRNGAGKTSLASIIMGLSGYRPTSGRITFNNVNITNLSVPERARMGLTLAFQNPVSIEGLKISNYILLGAKDKNEKTAREALERVDLDPDIYMKRTLDKSLSGGERKRIELAAVFAMRPRLAILDEPDSGIDAIAIEKIKELLLSFKKIDTALLLITHRATIAEIADIAYLMDAGRIIKSGPPKEVNEFFITKCGSCFHSKLPE